MYTYKLALFVLAATAAHAYPVASKNLESLALVAARRIPRIIKVDPRVERRQIHNADYQANSPPPSPNHGPAQDESSSPSPAKPAPSEPVPKDKRQIHNADYQANSPPPSPNHGPAQDESSSPSPAKPGPSESVPKDKRQIHNADYQANNPPPSPNHSPAQDESSSPSPAKPAPPEPTPKDKRQIHNADYQANGPPPSPNPGAAKDESSPANPPAAAPSSQSAPKDKRAALFEHTRASSIPISSRVDKSSLVMKKRSMAMALGGADTLAAANLVHHRAAKLVSLIAEGEWYYGWRRRNVEELTNAQNPDFDHGAVARWSRAEVDRMQAWSKGVHLRME